MIVEDFEEHKKLMEPFHRRYLATRKALEIWLKKVRKLDIDVIAPQHGSIFLKENAKKFLDWLDSLDKVGADLMG